jgi:pimeloyl-ACP methyl ester carboxylesterase
MEINARGLTFDVHVSGPEEGEPVLLLHGFPQDHREWDLILPRLHAAGLRTYALDQRGYSPGARPGGLGDYDLQEPVLDAVAVLDELGIGSAHVVGHDWGSMVAWMIASGHPDRVRTLTTISVPHPRGLHIALRNDPKQRVRFAYQKVLSSRHAEKLMLARDGALLRMMLKGTGPRAARYVQAMHQPGRLTGGLNWYRAMSGRRMAAVGKIEVPTTYVASDLDPIVWPDAVRSVGAWVAADYRVVVLRGIGHWIPEEAPKALADVVLERIRGNRG